MNKGFQKSWILILITMCLLFVFGLLGFIPFFARHEYLFTSLGELALILPIALGVGQLGKPEFFKSLKTGFSPSLIPILILIPFCMQTFVLYMTMPLHSLLYEIFGDTQSDVDNAKNLFEFAAQIFSVCILPAIIEEILCRGVVMDMMKPYGISAAMLISALAFTLLHFSVYSFTIIFMLGVMMAAVRIMTGSMRACILMHFSNNLFTLLMNYLPAENEFLAAAISILSFAFFPILTLRLLKKTEKNISALTDVKTEKMTFSPAMCICLAVFAATTLFETII